tara:strand:- start:224 stop:685 length:462 start_codon:yes stop_codon:yes gene_type:complete
MTASLHFSSFNKMLVLSTVLIAYHGLQVNSQILPDAPIEGIRVTMFSDEGFKLWNLQGESASYMENGMVEVVGMNLDVFQGKEGKEVDMRMLAAEAIYQSNDKTVSGDGGIFVDGDFYTIEGDSWRYSQDDRIVKVTSNVTVVINYQLGAFLK